MEDVVEVALREELAGLIATNTTLAREGACSRGGERMAG